jgi:hypothetical protein
MKIMDILGGYSEILIAGDNVFNDECFCWNTPSVKEIH